ncbi:MAG: sialidase family protein, partial [Bacteroidales bacterium]
MKKSTLIISFAVLISAAFGGYYLLHYKQIQRQAYEKAILEKAKNLPQASLQDKANEKSPDQPDMAAFQEYLMTMDPANGRVPKKSLYQSMLATKALEQSRSANSYTPPVEWKGTDATMGGRTRMIMFDPNDPLHEKVWAGGVTGGLWFNLEISDVNSWWEPVDDFWSSLSISSMAYDPNNTEIFYVGTGEAQTARTIYRESSGVGVGIFKSTDAGETWELLASTEQFDYITDLDIRDENGTSVVYACVASGTYHGEFQSYPSDGLYRSADGGTTWTQVLPDITGTPGSPYSPADIEIGPTGRIFIGTMENLELKGGATILYSDSGLSDSWTVYGDYNTLISNETKYKIPARTIVAVSPSDPEKVYAQFAAGYTENFIYYRGRYMV